MEPNVTLDPPRSIPLLGADIPEAELCLLDMGCEVLGEYAAFMRDYLDAVRPDLRPHLGKWMFDHGPSLGDALRVLRSRLPVESREPCGPECIVA